MYSLDQDAAAKYIGLSDSGDRTRFNSGAIRDMHEGKGRCDLMPLDIISLFITNYPDIQNIFDCIFKFKQSRDVKCLVDVILYFILQDKEGDSLSMILDLAKHYEAGAKKYGEHNWEKGIPVHSYSDSGIRHLLKYKRGDSDEPHDIAFIWNIVGAIWTCKYFPDMNDFC